MTQEWGPPLTGEQMKALRAAGLPDGTGYQFEDEGDWVDCAITPRLKHFHASYRLPANHVAYTLLEADWLDGRNVRLWFGGDKAPDDWDRGDVLLEDGRIIKPFTYLKWAHCSDGVYNNIIAYIAEDEEEYMPEIGFDSNEVDMGGIVRSIAETVTIAKMTEAEIIASWQDSAGLLLNFANKLGLIKPEPTRAERFWQGKERHSLYRDESARALIDAALEFER